MYNNKSDKGGETEMNACAMKPQVPFVTKEKLKRTPPSDENRKMVEFLDSHDFSFSVDKGTKNISSFVTRKWNMNIKKYDRKFAELADGFACGNIVIDKFLKDGSALDENQGITYVMLSDDEKFIIGYYNIEVGRIDQIQYIGDIATYVPLGGTVNINYLAIHSDFQGTKIGQIDD